MIYGDSVTAYSIGFKDGTELSLIAYSENQARLLAENAHPESEVVSMVSFEVDAFPY